MYITFFSRKEQRHEKIFLEITADGWFMDHECYRGYCDKEGAPHLFCCFEENYAEYPSAFGDALGELWKAAYEKQLPDTEIQQRLNHFSEWVLEYERTHLPSPSFDSGMRKL